MVNWKSVAIISRKREDAILVVVEAVAGAAVRARAKLCPLFLNLISTGFQGLQISFSDKTLHNQL